MVRCGMRGDGEMKNKEFYDLKKIECIADYKISGCGKIIPNKRLITILFDGKRITKRIETEKSVYRYLLDWAEEEKNDGQE